MHDYLHNIFSKEKGIMSENKFKPLSTIMILGIILFVGVGITVITIATMKFME